MLFLLVIFQIDHNLVILLLVELVEAEAACCDDPQHSRDGGEGVVHDAEYLRVLGGIAHISCLSEGDGEERGAESHSYLVAQGNKGVLETIVSDACLPFAILHAVGDDGIDGCVEAGEEEPRQCREQIEHDGTAIRAEEIEPYHRDACEEGEDGCRITLVARLSEHQWEAGCANDARHDNCHRIEGEERRRTFHVSEIVEHICVSAVMDKAEEQLPQEGEQVRLVLDGGTKLYLQWKFLCFWHLHYLLGLVEAEQVAGCEDDAVEHCHGEVTILGVASPKPTDERYGDDVDDSYRHHGANRTAGVELGSFVYVLGHRSAEGAVRQVDASVA